MPAIPTGGTVNSTAENVALSLGTILMVLTAAQQLSKVLQEVKLAVIVLASRLLPVL